MSSSKTFVQASLAAVSGAIVNAVVVIAKAWTIRRHRRAVNRLLYVDDYMLADIGISRGDVVASLSYGPLDDASRHLDALARERREGTRAQRREILEESRRTPPTGGGAAIASGIADLERAVA